MSADDLEVVCVPINRNFQALERKPSILWLGDLQGEPVEISYGKLQRTVTKVQNGLLTRLAKVPMGPTQDLPRVMLCVEEGVDLPVLVAATLFAGCTVVPASPSDPRIGDMVALCSPAAIVCSTPQQKELLLKRLGSGDQTRKAVWLLSELEEDGDNAASDSAQWRALGLDSASHVYFTSGTTGIPKATVSTHGMLSSYCRGKNEALKVTEESIVFLASRPTFDPSLGEIVSSLCCGATLVLASQAATLARLGMCLRRSKSTHILSTPALFSVLEDDPSSLPDLKVVALGGEPMGPHIPQMWGASPSVELYNLYGVTECCVYQAYSRVTAQSVPRLITQNLAGCHLALIEEAGSGKEVPERSGKRGEIWISGIQMDMGKYLGQKELTDAAYTIHDEYGRCYRTGDIAVAHVEGGLQLLGRRDTQVKVRGQRIDLAGIECVILEGVSAFVDSVVVVLQNAKLVAWCVLRCAEDLEVGRAKVMKALVLYLCYSRLPAHMVPAQIAFIEALPTSSTGKVSRSKVATMIPEDDEGGEVDEHFAGTWEREIARLWQEELGVKVISRHADFTGIGGNSLVALRTCRRLAQIVAELRSGDGCAGIVDTEFGDMLGPLAPAELISRPILSEYAAFVTAALGSLSSDSEDDEQSRDEAWKCSDGFHEKDAESVCLMAASAGHLPVLKYCVENLGVSPLGRPGAMSPLHLASAKGQCDVMEYLLDLGAGINASGVGGMVPLHVAAMGAPVEAVKLLLKRGATLVSIDSSKQTVLHHAARTGSPGKVMDHLLSEWSQDREVVQRSKRTPPLDWTDVWGRSPVHWAVVNGHRTAVAKLMELGANCKLKDSQGESPLEIAERRARCGAGERPDGMRPSVFGDIAKLLGGSGATKNVSQYAK